MKYLLLLAILMSAGACSSSNTDTSKTNNLQVDKIYPVAVSFGSIRCGTPSDDFLKSFADGFNKKNSVKITADIAAGCGKEGEFVILFNLPENNTAINSSFITELEKTVKETDDKNKKANTSSGVLQMQYNVKTSDNSYCRLGIKKWVF
ncbi:MAG TPA: hypothetical protein VLR49_05500 [Ferruginibacter sp.]|nr:hypothetical protein [Ferruginibacter sp.]